MLLYKTSNENPDVDTKGKHLPASEQYPKVHFDLIQLWTANIVWTFVRSGNFDVSLCEKAVHHKDSDRQQGRLYHVAVCLSGNELFAQLN